jgi:hypothetical protein
MLRRMIERIGRRTPMDVYNARKTAPERVNQEISEVPSSRKKGLT